MFVKTAAGRLVRWPQTMRPLADEGEEVPETEFWLTCLITGDIIEVPSPTMSDSGNVSTDAPVTSETTHNAPAIVDVEPAAKGGKAAKGEDA